MTDKTNKVTMLGMLFFVALQVQTPGAVVAAEPTMSISGPSGALLGWLMSKAEMSKKSDDSSFEELLQKAEMVYMDGGVNSTANLLGGMLSDPSYSHLQSSPLWDNARYLLASSLASRGALGKARKILTDLISKIPASDFAGPALRKLVDLTLASRQFKQTLISIEHTRMPTIRNQRDEILYMKAKALYKLGFTQKALEAFRRVSNSSRLFAAAVFMQGILSIESGRPEQAEDIFCKLTHGGTEHKTPFFLSDNASRVVQNAWLALARLRHDRGRFDQAIDTYTSIPLDSPLYTVAQYESAWSRFRLGDFSGARTTLENILESHSNFPQRPMAQILLGYSLLGQCNFEKAKAIFEDLGRHLDSIYSALTDSTQPATAIPIEALSWIKSKKLESNSIALEVEIQESVSWVRWLGWELNRAWSSDSFSAKVQGPEFKTEYKLRHDIERAKGMLQRLAQIRIELSSRANNSKDLKDLRIMQAQVSAALMRASSALDRLVAGNNSKPHVSPTLPISYLNEEKKNLDSLKSRLLEQFDKARQMESRARSKLVKKSQSTCAKLVRMTMLGKIDAVTGQKQALETEVQNLALGRYPLSLLRDLAKAGLLDEESEYWPFDGESWPDEYE